MPQVLQESKKPVIVIKDNYQNIVSKKNKSVYDALIPEESQILTDAYN